MLTSLEGVICYASINVLLSTNIYPRIKTVQDNVADIIVTSLIRCLKYSSRGFNCLNNITNYYGINLKNWYLTYNNAVSSVQRSDIRYLLKKIILLNEDKATATVFYIYKYGVSLYNNTILNFSHHIALESLKQSENNRILNNIYEGENNDSDFDHFN